ncbi:DUF262 domain-containing protein [Pontibacillus litoralis]|uniref:GmrSD restriction endonucleases N-terminal domain-containing protein n=1 Tax=Pontibacillus litoralis JSM 072002 TaxID=1385512 RepID=A0A0A5GDE0_9BACI|nr:DUF262 domain-containing protein [Pontibacillus litoralis]KGX89228.1 hypothetical protein N784_02365 [Pontibacillus litoralis JSM 072002]
MEKKKIERLTDCTTNEERITLWRNMGTKVERKVIDLVSFIKIVGKDANAEWVKPDVLPPSNEYLVVGDIQRTYTDKNEFKTQFIESVLMGLPLGTITIKKTRQEHNEYGDIINVHEVMDGQHRLRALYDFIEGDYKLSPTHLKFLQYEHPISFTSKKPKYCLEPVLRARLRDTRITVLEVSEGDSVSKQKLDEFGVYSFLNINKTVDNMSEYVKMKAEYTSRNMAEIDDLLSQYTEEFSKYFANRLLWMRIDLPVQWVFLLKK